MPLFMPFETVLLVLLVSILGVSASNVLDPKYQTSCSLTTTGTHPPLQTSNHECFVALFSYKNISFVGPIVYTEDNLCGTSVVIEEHWRETLLNQPLAITTKRGGCSFTEKARNAEAAGFKLLVVINNDKGAFPVGPAAVDFPLSMPVLMAGSDIIDVLQLAGGQSHSGGQQQLEASTDGESSVIAEEAALPAVGSFPKISVQFAVLPEPRAVGKVPQPRGDGRAPGPELNAPAVKTLHLLVTLAITAAAAVLMLAFWVALDPALLAYPYHISHPVPAPDLSTGRDHVVGVRELRTDGPAGGLENTVTVTVAAEGRRVAAESALWLAYLTVGALFVALRLGTLRVYFPAGRGDNATGGDVYNHRETDERVFEALVSNVLQDWSDYRLHEGTIQELGLAGDNYSDSLFIHPPVFVYLSAALHRYAGVPLALVPLLLQACTLALLPAILCKVLPPWPAPADTLASSASPDHTPAGRSDSRLRAAVAGLVAWGLFSCCPVAAFCSQKFWIDNCLMLAVTVSAAAHVWLLPIYDVQYVSQGEEQAHRRRFSETARCMVSGAIFGAVGMNTKITAAALLPFAVCWIAARHVVVTLKWNSNDSRKKGKCAPLMRVLSCTVGHTGAYLLGAVLTYGPWTYLYWASTGRLTPNAWPSAEMLQRSSFVRAAVGKPWHCYLVTLARCAPVHGAALLGGCALAGRVVPGLWRALVRRERKCGGQDMSHRGSGPPRSEPLIVSTPAPTEESGLSCLPLLALAVWPLGFLAALTLLGSLGSGFQSRFLSPMLPGSVLLTAALLDSVAQRSQSCGYVRLLASTCSVVVALLAAYSAANAVYYGALYAPLFADLDVSLVDVVAGILRSPYSSPGSREAFQDTLRFMAHYGLDRQSR